MRTDEAVYKEWLHTARDAVSYTIHHEAGLTKFPDDGNIPPDNSYSERIVKAVALGRPTGSLP